jgi:transposase
MFTVELYAGIRRAVMVDGLSRREAAKRLGVHRNTISKMLQFGPAGLSAARAASFEEAWPLYGLD